MVIDKRPFQFYRGTPATTPTATASGEPTFDPPKLPQFTSSLFIEFHVLLSKEEWFWDESAAVYLTFSHHGLGGFGRCCYGPMAVTEYVFNFYCQYFFVIPLENQVLHLLMQHIKA